MQQKWRFMASNQKDNYCNYLLIYLNDQFNLKAIQKGKALCSRIHCCWISISKMTKLLAMALTRDLQKLTQIYKIPFSLSQLHDRIRIHLQFEQSIIFQSCSLPDSPAICIGAVWELCPYTSWFSATAIIFLATCDGFEELWLK